MKDGYLSRINVAKYRIELTSADVLRIRFASFRVGPKEHPFWEKRIQQIFVRGSLQRSLDQMDSTTSVCAEEERLSTFWRGLPEKIVVTKGDIHPTPHLVKCTLSLGEAAVASNPDVSSGYWEVEIANKDCKNTAIFSRQRLRFYVGGIRLTGWSEYVWTNSECCAFSG